VVGDGTVGLHCVYLFQRFNLENITTLGEAVK